MASQSEPQHEHELNHYWNELVRDASQSPLGQQGLNSATAAMLTWFQQFGSTAAPASSRERVRRRLQRHIAGTQAASAAERWHDLAPLQLAPMPESPNGHALEVVDVRSGRNRVDHEAGRTMAQLAAAALVAFALLGAFMAFGSVRPEQPPAQPILLSAVSSTPSAPATTEAPIAAVLWQSGGGPNLPFGLPSRPAIDAQGVVWVPDAHNDQFLLFDSDGTFLEAWGTPGDDRGQFRLSEPYADFGTGGVAFDGAGNIYVADTGNSRIQKFGPDRELISSWGREGAGQGEFRRPTALAVDGRGRVYVADEGWGKIEVFDDEGVWLATWTGLGAPGDITVAGDGTIWVADGGGGAVQFSPEGERLTTWNSNTAGAPAGLDATTVAADAEGRIFVADLHSGQILVFSPEGALLGAWGESGDETGQLHPILGLALDGQGNMYVTDHTAKSVQKLQLLPPLAP
ncbi:MAG: NHL repeat-containing protein [Thermomicrobiales bacterium]|nr:NHL repeat-containing protein [Thermomicrobiales bacterium]